MFSAAESASSTLASRPLPGSSGTPLGLGEFARRVLQAEGFDSCSGRRADEGDALGRKPLGEADILRQEAVAGMHGLRAGRLAGGDDGIDIEIAFAGGRGTEAHASSASEHRHGEAVGVGIDGDGGDAHALQRPDDADGDFAAIGDQDFPEHFSSPGIGLHPRSGRGSASG